MRLERLQRTGGSGTAGGGLPRQQAGLAERATLKRDAGLRAPVAGARGAGVGGRGEAKILERLEGMFREKDAGLEREVTLSRSATLVANQGQIDGFFGRLPYKCHQNRMASMGDCLEICPRGTSRMSLTRFDFFPLT